MYWESSVCEAISEMHGLEGLLGVPDRSWVIGKRLPVALELVNDMSVLR
jgi:hypothetical protein